MKEKILSLTFEVLVTADGFLRKSHSDKIFPKSIHQIQKGT
jgi:hypothetical protein